MQGIDVFFYIAILIMSVVIHEVSHGFMAEYYGDKTARLAGRLTLNPIVHLDLVGSVLLPIFLYFTFGFAFGWAKPVPYNPRNLRDQKWGTVAVAGAGILANLSIAILFGLVLRFFGASASISFNFIVSTIVLVNLALAIFNLVPVPPLDGYKIFSSLLPPFFHSILESFERYSLLFLVVFIFFFSNYLFPILTFFYHLITGIKLLF